MKEQAQLRADDLKRIVVACFYLKEHAGGSQTDIAYAISK